MKRANIAHAKASEPTRRVRCVVFHLFAAQTFLFLSTLPAKTSALSRLPAPVDRRSFFASAVLAGPVAAAVLTLPDVASASAPPPELLYPNGGSASLIRPYYEVGSWNPASLPPTMAPTTKLARERILATQLSPLNSPLVLPFGGDKDTYYPSFLFGTWNVKSTLRSKKYPYGTDVLPSKSLLEGSIRNRDEQVGDATSYEVRYFSLLDDDADSASTAASGGSLASNRRLNRAKPIQLTSKSKIIADRAYDAFSLSRAYQQLTPVQDVDWDYRKDPMQLTLRYAAGAVANDMRPLGQRRGEVYITARASEVGGGGDGGGDSSTMAVFCVAERSRSVTVAPGNVIVTDAETITEYRRVDDDRVVAVSRVAVYLTPNPNSREGVIWQQVGGKAVAFYDYEWEMTRQKTSLGDVDESSTERVCVGAPSGVAQCI